MKLTLIFASAPVAVVLSALRLLRSVLRFNSFNPMGKKCCVYGCKTGYLSQKGQLNSENKATPVFRFPKDEGEKKAWIEAVPNAKLVVSQDTVVCELHWPPGYASVSTRGKLRPKYPPSIWPNVPLSQIPTPARPSRKTKNSSCFERNREEDMAILTTENWLFS